MGARARASCGRFACFLRPVGQLLLDLIELKKHRSCLRSEAEGAAPLSRRRPVHFYEPRPGRTKGKVKGPIAPHQTQASDPAGH